MLRHRPGLLALVALSALLPGAVLHRFGSTQLPLDGRDHFVLVAIGAATAALASVGLTTAGVRNGDGRTVLLGTAFSTMTALLAVHGIATPGVIVGPNGVIALAGGISLPAGAVVLALSALPSLRRPRRMGPLLALQAGLAVGIVALGAIGLSFPSLVPAVPQRGSAEAVAVMVLGVALFALLAHRALRTFALTRRVTDLLVALGCAWLGFSSFAWLTVAPGTVGFYLGHLLELTGVVLVGIPSTPRSSAIPRRASACCASSEGSPPRCWRSSRRTTSAWTARATPAAWPARSSASAPRILAVCDVYDALVSDRVYREAWAPERALELLRKDTGSAFDGRCVWALQRVLGAAVPAPAGVRG